MFVGVTRLLGPDNTLITLVADGRVMHLEGSSLVIRRWGRGAVDPALARSLVARAAALIPPATNPDADIEGDLYFIARPGAAPLVAREGEAPADLRAFVDAVVRAVASVKLEANRSYFLSTEPVDEARAARLKASRVRSISVAELQATPGLKDPIQTALARSYRLQEIEEAVFRELLQRVKGREEFTTDASGKWFQLKLWSPPE